MLELSWELKRKRPVGFDFDWDSELIGIGRVDSQALPFLKLPLVILMFIQAWEALV